MNFTKQTIDSQEVFLDGNQFHDVRFVNCQIIYVGFAPVVLDECTFVDSPLRFEGPAGNVMTFLQALAHSGDYGKSAVEQMLAPVSSEAKHQPN